MIFIALFFLIGGYFPTPDSSAQSKTAPNGLDLPVDNSSGGSIERETKGGQDSPILLSLVPNRFGLTLQEQPILHWYLSKPTKHRLVLTVNDERLVKPILETTLTTEPRQGFHSIQLQDYNIRLELDTTYRWFIELVVDTDYPSKNITAGGRIQRIVPPEGLLDRLRNAEPQDVTAIYFEEGLWYDGLASIYDPIEKKINSTQYQLRRKALLEQVDLIAVAKAEEDVPPPESSLFWSDRFDRFWNSHAVFGGGCPEGPPCPDSSTEEES